MSSKLPPHLVGCVTPQGDCNHPAFATPAPGLINSQVSSGSLKLYLASDLELNFPDSNTITWSASGLNEDQDLRILLSETALNLKRGRFGRITLFTYQRESELWFSTRLDALIKRAGITSPVDPRQLRIFANFSWLPAPLSSIPEIVALRPGEEVSFQIHPSRKATTSSMSDAWGENQPAASDLGLAGVVLESMLLDEAQRQTSDLKGETVGVLLSGGLDSSLTAAALAKCGARVKAFCLDFGEYGKPEVEFAEAVAGHLKIPLHLIHCGPSEVWSSANAAIRSLDLPYGDGVTVPLYLGSREVSRECGVLFNGEGGDQLFAGWTNKPMIADSVYGGPDSFLESYMRTFHRFRGAESSAINPDAVDLALDGKVEAGVQDALAAQFEGEALLHRLRRANLRLKGAQNIQPRATALALSHGLKLRSLFCSDAIADWTFSLKPEWFLHNSQEKYVLKLAIRDWLPETVVWREKRGMGVPLTSWLTGPLWRKIGSFLHPRIISSLGLWQPPVPLRLATGNLGAPYQGRRIGELLWLILSLQVWLGERTGLPSPFLIPANLWRSISANNLETAEFLWQLFDRRS